jgi:hypothetical protein
MTYVAEYFHAFSSMGETRSAARTQHEKLTVSLSSTDKTETVVRRIEKFTEVMSIVE